MTLLRATAIGLLLALTSSCSDDEESGDQRACDAWFDLAESDDPSDEEAMQALQRIVAMNPSEDIAGTARAMSARLRDDVDISRTFQRMNDLCADV